MKNLLKILLTLSICSSFVCFAADKTSLDADTALKELMDGNAHFVKSKMEHPHQDLKRVSELTKGQHPIAAIISCSDSRVTPEIIFDQGLGDLFIIRDAGNVADINVIASVEYATEHLGVPLVVVLGHTKCGALTAALENEKDTNHIMHLFKELNPVVCKAKREGGDVLNNAIKYNVINVVKNLKKSQPLIAKQVRKGQVKIVGAIYNIDTGVVDIISE